MDSKKSNKISDIVRLQQILKKWRKLATSHHAPKNPNNTITNSSSRSSNNSSGSNKGIKFIKRTLSFTDIINASNNDHAVKKGYLAVCVGQELKRYIIPTEYLGHQAFRVLLREAEEEFGFQQEGVLKIPCEISVFDKILKVVEGKKNMKRNYYDDHEQDHDNVFFLPDDCYNQLGFDTNGDLEHSGCCSPDNCEFSPSHLPQVCR